MATIALSLVLGGRMHGCDRSAKTFSESPCDAAPFATSHRSVLARLPTTLVYSSDQRIDGTNAADVDRRDTLAFKGKARGAKRCVRRRRSAAWGKESGKRSVAGQCYPRRRVDDTGIAARDLLALANAVYERVPWVSAKAAAGNGQATWERIYEMHHDCDAFNAFREAHPDFRVSVSDESVADDIMAWASDGAFGRDDYRATLAIALASEDVAGNAFATVCSAVAAYRSERERHVGESYVGTIGRRDILTLTLKRVAAVPHRFGTSYRLTFNDRDGNGIVWFSSRAPESLGLAIEQSCAIKATIRRHAEYLGSKQTVISRGRLVEAA